MVGFDEQKKLFGLIGKTLKSKVECFVVGGSAMMFYTFGKTVTKDIDIVLKTDKDRNELTDALKDIGFEEFVKPTKAGNPSRLRFRDSIFDLFSGSVIRIRVSDNMLKKAVQRAEFGNLGVLVASPEYIILSKSMTDREGDRKDVIDIIKDSNVNWDVIIEEAEWQSKNNPDVAFGLYLFDFLEELEDERKIVLPKQVKRKIISIYKKQLDDITDSLRPNIRKIQSLPDRDLKARKTRKHIRKNKKS